MQNFNDALKPRLRALEQHAEGLARIGGALYIAGNVPLGNQMRDTAMSLQDIATDIRNAWSWEVQDYCAAGIGEFLEIGKSLGYIDRHPNIHPETGEPA